MFHFYSTEQTKQNISYHKGMLFEDLLRKYLVAAGYNVDLRRRKENSLEYDLHGTHVIDQRPVIGEAKAQAETISGQDVAAFVGKSIGLLMQRPPYSAVFLSTSPLAPEAADYLRATVDSTGFQIVADCGADLERQIRDRLRLPSLDLVRARIQTVIPTISGQDLLHTNRGTFILVKGSGEPAAFDDRFALVSDNGRVVSDQDLLEGVKQSIQSLQELQPVVEPQVHSSQVVSVDPRTIPAGLITATNWLDYRRPAGARFFVGRADALEKASAVINNPERSVVLELKSRSGVGKSSLLAVLGERWASEGNAVEVHDARDVQSASDVLTLVQRFTGLPTKITSFEQVQHALAALQGRLGEKRGMFLVDQFESTFVSPEVYFAYEYIALCIAKASPGLAMVYARKDDLLTTHDDIMVSLDRLRSLSESISLDDFPPAEASTLLTEIARATPRRISVRVLEQVLEFAQGFPWLLKRTMAHVATVLSRGANQTELLSEGLHLEALFEEEIAGLDEHERGYLTRLAAVLPATYQSLARRFENDPFLLDMLEKLTDRRLLRLSAGIYDTYNDVLKDFLLWERLPERSQAQLFRSTLVPVMQGFRALGGQNRIEAEHFGRQLGKPLGSTYNLLREMRLAGLVVHSASGWVISEVARQYEHQGRLGEFVRQSVLRNRVVSDFISRVEKAGFFAKREVAPFLREQFPFVKAKDEIWSSYANILLDWLLRLRLIRLAGDENVVLETEDKEHVLRALGNLNLSGKGSRPVDAAFVPSSALSVATRLLTAAQNKVLVLDELPRSLRNALYDLKKCGAVREEEPGRYVASRDPATFESELRTLFADEPYTTYWNLLISGVLWGDAVEQAFGLSTLAPATRTSLGKKLANWGRALGFMPKRLSFAKRAQLTLG